jgi:hypothetical protein
MGQQLLAGEGAAWKSEFGRRDRYSDALGISIVPLRPSVLGFCFGLGKPLCRF